MNRTRLLAILCYFFTSLTASAGTNNIATSAKVSASTTLSSNFNAANVIDGIIGVNGKGEWACKGVSTDWGYVRFPWIKLDWQEPQTINKILLFDRPNMNDHIAGGKLLFSDGSQVWVNEIPNDGTAKLVKFDAKTVTWIKFVTTDGKGKDLGFSEIEVYPATPVADDYVSWVDPYIETNRGRYFFFITGQTPFGMIGAAPLTRNKNQNGGGYNYNENEILQFSQIHTWMISGIGIMPALASTNPTLGVDNWKSVFSHDDEIVQPGYQRVFLRTPKTWVEFTATERVSFYKFTYLTDTVSRLIMNFGGHISNSTMANADVKKVSNQQFEGSFSSVNRFWGGPKDVKIFFVIQTDKPCKALNGWQGQKNFSNIDKINGDSAGLAADFDVKAGESLQMKIAISYTSIDNARNNLQSECDEWNFAETKKQTQKTWNDWLGKIEVKGGTTEQKTKFYTDLWHVLLGRQKLNDISGDYPDRMTGKREGAFTDAIFKVRTLPKDAAGKVKYNMYNSDAFWLTQWNLNILWGLAWPQVADDISASLVQYADNGYLLPRGPCGGGDSYIMTSCPATNLITSTFQKGLLTKVDKEHSFNIIKQNHLPGGMLGSKEDIEFYTKHGWWKNNAGITVEATFQDYAIAQMAQRLGKKKDYNFFSKRSTGWKNCFNPVQGLLFPKDEKGSFTHNNPLSGEGFVEANAWQATFGVSQDIPALARLMGGNDSLCNKLNYAFEQAASEDFVFDYTNGYVSYANQPGLSNAHVFNYAGKPWLTQYWVRRVQSQAYGGITPDLGYGGQDEDQGQMGALSALMSIGLFSLKGTVSQNPVYDITSPIFDEVIIKLDKSYYKGTTFTIKTYNNEAKNYYIQKVQLNGQTLNKFWFTHTDFTKGGTLEIWLGPAPNKSWGIESLPH